MNASRAFLSGSVCGLTAGDGWVGNEGESVNIFSVRLRASRKSALADWGYHHPRRSSWGLEREMEKLG